ncbi:MAG: protein-disulfide reductase DsbD [Piscirickettsiaceae bacterium]|nr:protein-disulfide reductase DsbD [Piscirickettsiaceae bacterium]
MKKILFVLLLFIVNSINAGSVLLYGLGLNDDLNIPPSMDEAFIFSIEDIDANHLLARWRVADGSYLYRNKIYFEITDNDDVRLLPFLLPAGNNKIDEIFGLSEVYQNNTDIELYFDRTGYNPRITLKAYYQGCSETFHICYPPTTKKIILTLPRQTNIDGGVIKDDLSLSSSRVSSLSEQDYLAKSLAQDSRAKNLLVFFGLGILLAFTPCIFPMIPILSSIIINEGNNVSIYRAFILSLTYVLSMSVTYTSVGMLTGLLGENLQAVLQIPWIIGSFSFLFIILSLSMFGIFELCIPRSLQQSFHIISHKQRGGTLVNTALMGLMSGVIVGPCLVPPLAGALLFIGQQGDPILGGLALFAMNLGMGVPLIAIGVSEGSILLRVGAWMGTIKLVFGFLMLGLAIWMLERIMPGWIISIFWGILIIIAVIYLGVFNPLGVDAGKLSKISKFIGIILLIYGSLLIINVAKDGDNIWKFYNVVYPEINIGEAKSIQFTEIDNLSELNSFLSDTTKPIILDFYADWCVDCGNMEVTTFIDKDVKRAMDNWQLLQIDITSNNDAQRILLKKLKVFGPPTILFFNASGKEYLQYRLMGGISSDNLLEHLTTLLKLPSNS